MTYPIEWSREAEHTFSEILLYLEEKWTLREVTNFIDRTEVVLNFIQQNPLQYQYSKTIAVYRAVLTPQTSLYYEVYQDKIVLLSFLDNRRDPSTKKLR